jgi:hypothetical protein
VLRHDILPRHRQRRLRGFEIRVGLERPLNEVVERLRVEQLPPLARDILARDEALGLSGADVYTNVYQNYNQPLGSEIGPDADYGMVAADTFLRGWLRLAADVGVWRRGLQRIYERPGQGPNGQANAPFPTTAPGRPVQTAAIADASMQLLTVGLPITARIQAARVHDTNYLPVGSANYLQAQLMATYAFRYP